MEGNGVGGHIQGEEENQINFQGLRDRNVIFVTPPPHGESPWDSHATYPGFGRRWRGTGDIWGVLPMGVEVGGVSGGWVPREVTRPSKTQREFHVSVLEVED